MSGSPGARRRDSGHPRHGAGARYRRARRVPRARDPSAEEAPPTGLRKPISTLLLRRSRGGSARSCISCATRSRAGSTPSWPITTDRSRAGAGAPPMRSRDISRSRRSRPNSVLCSTARRARDRRADPALTRDDAGPPARRAVRRQRGSAARAPARRAGRDRVGHARRPQPGDRAARARPRPTVAAATRPPAQVPDRGACHARRGGFELAQRRPPMRRARRLCTTARPRALTRRRRLPRLIGTSRALDMILTSRPVAARERSTSGSRTPCASRSRLASSPSAPTRSRARPGSRQGGRHGQFG